MTFFLLESSRAAFLHLEHVSESLGALIKTQTAGPFPRNFCLGWGLRIRNSNNSPDDAGAAGRGTILRKPMT